MKIIIDDKSKRIVYDGERKDDSGISRILYHPEGWRLLIQNFCDLNILIREVKDVEEVRNNVMLKDYILIEDEAD